MITDKMIKDMKDRDLLAIGGVIYISNDILIAQPSAKKINGIGSMDLNKHYTLELKECSIDKLKEVLINIFDDSLYHDTKNIEFCCDKSFLDKQINKDKRNKIIDDCFYISIKYCNSEYLNDKFSLILCDRDGSAWIGKKNKKFVYEREDELSLVKKIKILIDNKLQTNHN